MFKIANRRDDIRMNSNKVNKSIFRQFNIGIWWGGLRNLLQQANFYLLAITCVSSVATLFVTVINPWLVDNFGIRIPFYIMVIAAAGILMVILLFEHKLTMPSYFSYWNEQWWFHGNLLRERLDIRDKEINEQYKQICDKIDSIGAELKKLQVALLKKKSRRKH